MSGSLNSYVVTSTILSRQNLCAASSNQCHDPVSCRDNISILVLVVTMFLVLSEFLSRPRKSITTEFCRHLT